MPGICSSSEQAGVCHQLVLAKVPWDGVGWEGKYTLPGELQGQAVRKKKQQKYRMESSSVTKGNQWSTEVSPALP